MAEETISYNMQYPEHAEADSDGWVDSCALEIKRRDSAGNWVIMPNNPLIFHGGKWKRVVCQYGPQVAVNPAEINYGAVSTNPGGSSYTLYWEWEMTVKAPAYTYVEFNLTNSALAVHAGGTGNFIVDGEVVLTINKYSTPGIGAGTMYYYMGERDTRVFTIRHSIEDQPENSGGGEALSAEYHITNNYGGGHAWLQGRT